MVLKLGDINTFRPKHQLKKTGIDRERKMFLSMLREANLNDDYRIFGKFRGIKKVNRFKHKECGNTFEMNATKLLEGISCPKCSLAKTLRYRDLFIKSVLEFNLKEFVSEDVTRGDKFIINKAVIGKLQIELLFDGRLRFIRRDTGKPFREGYYSIFNQDLGSLTNLIKRHLQVLDIKIIQESKHEESTGQCV